MTIQGSIDHAPRTGIADLQTRLVDYAGLVDELRSPKESRTNCTPSPSALPAVARSGRGLSPNKVRRLGVRSAREICLPSRRCPPGLVSGCRASCWGKFHCPALFLAGFSMASHTWTEVRRLMQPIGIDKSSCGLLSQVRHARWIDVPSWRSVGRGILVAQRTFQRPDATNSTFAIRCQHWRLSGVFAGANTQYIEIASYPGRPEAATVGRSGNSSNGVALVTASARSLPAFTCGSTEVAVKNDICTWPVMRW